MLLALETSSREASVALFRDGELAARADLPAGETTAQSLTPTIQRLLQQAEVRASDLEAIAVAQGPGSFTGLRIGVVTAKTLAYAAGAQLIGMDTLEVIAAQASEEPVEVQVVLDAQRKQLFYGRFAVTPGARPQVLAATSILDQPAWRAQLQPGDLVTGPALHKLASSLPPDVRQASDDLWRADAVTVGRLALERLAQGEVDDLWSLEPHYHRLSAAEEKANQR
ncbi:tRNA (adenosine(37)-N6)-threonylcarbamoyltransferase complex dimerization subunit type 1 TsaB [Lignipirellula cremea]|uniref:tRNA threonylcarbamoyladenosine biosynthesis protein TsaB n=1 Tax=Lignipirellula cremea TaxID=2528010 RepID=A0A518DXZ6_9BACT|nr:tRNA (adenosine(37)-N6)-threonylcarbamoyltransferase complex dimerization subunit type 1 TsaB [Lignipirellula cremea]QDU96723.1 tRNA threonylcarbamoyladenosine biosynthesis protein TsaB [Lignipirellula cremea]